MKTTRIHVDQHAIKANRKGEPPRPVLTVKDYQQNRKCNEAVIYAADGTEVARVVYRPDNPLSCGAHVWIETQLPVTTA